MIEETYSSFKRAYVSFEEGMKCVEKLIERGIIEIETSQHHFANKRSDDRIAKKLLFTTPFLDFGLLLFLLYIKVSKTEKL